MTSTLWVVLEVSFGRWHRTAPGELLAPVLRSLQRHHHVASFGHTGAADSGWLKKGSVSMECLKNKSFKGPNQAKVQGFVNLLILLIHLV